jgi:putative spermidine/putrescine transport system permease protein
MMPSQIPANSVIMTTADGRPLKPSLARALRRSKLKTLLLATPLFLFILVTFLLPIGDMLLRGVELPRRRGLTPQ